MMMVVMVVIIIRDKVRLVGNTPSAQLHICLAKLYGL